MTTLLLWVLCVAVITAICVRIANQDYKEVHGYSRKDFRRYRRLMADSKYRSENKKGQRNADLIRNINLN